MRLQSMVSIYCFAVPRPPVRRAPSDRRERGRRDRAALQVVSTDEARALAANRPASFLRISRPEIDLPPGSSPYSDRGLSMRLQSMVSIYCFAVPRPPVRRAPSDRRERGRRDRAALRVVSTDEARALVANRPASFLRISRPEIDLPPGSSPYSDRGLSMRLQSMVSIYGFAVPRPPVRRAPSDRRERGRRDRAALRVVSTDEARALAANRPASFLRISRPEIDLPPGSSPYSDAAYERGAENLARLRDGGVLVRDREPSFYAIGWS